MPQIRDHQSSAAGIWKPACASQEAWLLWRFAASCHPQQYTIKDFSRSKIGKDHSYHTFRESKARLVECKRLHNGSIRFNASWLTTLRASPDAVTSAPLPVPSDVDGTPDCSSAFILAADCCRRAGRRFNPFGTGPAAQEVEHIARLDSGRVADEL